MADTAVPVFDRAQLDRRALGDARLEVEILALFVTEAERLLGQIERAADAQVRGDRLRAMIALARSTGAMRIARAARALETDIVAVEPDLRPLRDAVAEAILHVQRNSA